MSDEKVARKRKPTGNGDEVAQMLAAASGPAELRAIAEKHGLVDKWDSWEHLGPGQRRMCLGNSIRGQKRREERERAPKAA